MHISASIVSIVHKKNRVFLLSVIAHGALNKKDPQPKMVGGRNPLSRSRSAKPSSCHMKPAGTPICATVLVVFFRDDFESST